LKSSLLSGGGLLI